MACRYLAAVAQPPEYASASEGFLRPLGLKSVASLPRPLLLVAPLDWQGLEPARGSVSRCIDGILRRRTHVICAVASFKARNLSALPVGYSLDDWQGQQL
jgi:hypothetical protein